MYLPAAGPEAGDRSYETLTLCKKSCFTSCLISTCQTNVGLPITKQDSRILAVYPPISVHLIKWASEQIRQQSPSAPLYGNLSRLTTPRVLSTKTPSSGQGLCQSCWRQRYQDSKDDRHIFVSISCNYNVYADIGLEYPCMHCLVSILDTGARPSFFSTSELSTVLESHMSFGPLFNSATPTIHFGC